MSREAPLTAAHPGGAAASLGSSPFAASTQPHGRSGTKILIRLLRCTLRPPTAARGPSPHRRGLSPGFADQGRLGRARDHARSWADHHRRLPDVGAGSRPHQHPPPPPRAPPECLDRITANSRRRRCGPRRGAVGPHRRRRVSLDVASRRLLGGRRRRRRPRSPPRPRLGRARRPSLAPPFRRGGRVVPRSPLSRRPPRRRRGRGWDRAGGGRGRRRGRRRPRRRRCGEVGRVGRPFSRGPGAGDGRAGTGGCPPRGDGGGVGRLSPSGGVRSAR